MNYKKKFTETYKKQIISNLIKLINNKFNYEPICLEPTKIQNDYKLANFENKNFNKFTVDDYIEGELNSKVSFEITDLHVEKRQVNGYGKQIENIFQGMFIKINSNRNINTYIKISKNNIKILEQQDRIEMDNPEFEKQFDVYSENKLITMQLLTSEIMELLLSFYERYKLNYEIIIRDEKIYMRFFTGSMFEPKESKNAMDKQLLFTYYSILKFIVEISEKLNMIIGEAEI